MGEKEKKIFKKTISRFNGGAQNSTYSHSLILFKRKNIKPIRKILFPPPFVFCYYFSLTLFFLFLQSSHQFEKKRNILKEKNQLQIKKMAHPSRRIRSLNISKILRSYQILRSETSSWTLLFANLN